MNKIKLKYVITLVVCVALMTCLLVPSYALPMSRGYRRMQRDIEGTGAAETLLPMPEGNITEGETQDGIIGDDIVTTEKPALTTTPTTTERPALTTTPTTTTPRTTVTTGVVGEVTGGNGVALGIVLAVILAGVLVAIIMMTSRGKKR